jgi:hypothetical protein
VTFSYTLTADVGKVRLEIGDTVSGSGVRSSGANLTDEEIQVWLDAEDDDVMLAAARACEMLARDWAKAASIQLGPRREQLSDVAKAWERQAQALRDQYGSGSIGSGIQSGFYQGYADIQEPETAIEIDEE